jgi:TPR repeat protein
MKKQVISISALCAAMVFSCAMPLRVHAAPVVVHDERFAENLKRAESGDVDKQMSVGCDFLDGKGVEKNEKQGLYWLNSAVTAGSAAAAYELAGRYETGKGVAKDGKETLRLYEVAAGHLSPLAQRELGRIHAEGVITPRDPVLAYIRYDLAVQLGYEKAADARDALEKELSPEQLEKARKTAQFIWKKLPARKTKIAAQTRLIFATHPKAAAGVAK